MTKSIKLYINNMDSRGKTILCLNGIIIILVLVNILIYRSNYTFVDRYYNELYSTSTKDSLINIDDNLSEEVTFNDLKALSPQDQKKSSPKVAKMLINMKELTHEQLMNILKITSLNKEDVLKESH